MFPLFLPPEARRLFQTESLLRRLAHAAHWSKESRLLELCGSLGGLALCRALSCKLTTIEADPKQLEVLKERARVAGLAERVTFLQQAVESLALEADGFDGIFALGRVVGPLDGLLARLRPALAGKGRLGLTTVVKVGRSPPASALEAWGKRLGAPLLLPRDVLQAVEAAGFEPELLETVSDLELDEYYQELEVVMARGGLDPAGLSALQDEIALHRAHNAHSGVAYAVVVARRKEPGEKPPLSRDSG